MARTADDVSEQIAELMEEFENKLRAETRRDCADELRDRFVDRSHTKVSYPMPVQDQIIEALRIYKSLGAAAFKGVADRYDEDGVPADFRLGLLFAINLLKDKDFEI